jgi:hypothetical protein
VRKRRRVIVVENGKISMSQLRKLVKNPKRIMDEDEADYQAALASIRASRGKSISLEALKKKYGYR